MVTVRPAVPTDAEDVARTNIRGWQQAYAGIVPDSVLAAMDTELATRTERFRQRFSAPEAEFTTLVATETDRAVGFVTYGPYRLAGDQRDHSVGEVLAIYVDPAAQGRGTGRALLDPAVAAIRARGLSEVRLWVLTDNTPARAFYQRYGFVPDGARHYFRVIEPDGTPVDLPEVRYALRF